jgi:hypothetical protein
MRKQESRAVDRGLLQGVECISQWAGVSMTAPASNTGAAAHRQAFSQKHRCTPAQEHRFIHSGFASTADCKTTSNGIK